MALERWDPFAEMRRFNGYFVRGSRGFPVSGHDAIKNSWYIPLDAVEEGDDLLVRASVPGVNPEDIEVTMAAEAKTSRKTRYDLEHCQRWRGLWPEDTANVPTRQDLLARLERSD